PLYRVRIKGEFALNEGGRIFNLHMIASAEQRWHDAAEAGRLCIGVDPAGESGMGDETMFCMRRGFKCLAFRGFRGLNEDQHLTQVLMILSDFKLPRETPMVVIDREGSIGSRLNILLRNYRSDHPYAFDLVAVRASDGAPPAHKEKYGRVRDVLAKNLEEWFRGGGAIPEDVKLEKELHAFEWSQSVNGKFKITNKDVIRKMIGRSPDRYDALALAVWERPRLDDDAELSPSQEYVLAGERVAAGGGLDPYEGSTAWEPKP
ncbi:MAG TPA: hypothetical protein VKE42_05210, partial [Candidatus Cybelea sp.]|nr:hypothetical protein [Candidatus Cybelea sp.]